MYIRPAMVRRRRPDDDAPPPRSRDSGPLPLVPNLSGLELMILLLKRP